MSTSMRAVVWVMMVCASAGAEPSSVWQFVPADAKQAVYMDWQRVLNSALSDPIRREVPAEASASFGSLNYFEGIAHVVLVRTHADHLVILGGSFDMERMKVLAEADGGTVTIHRNATVLTPMEAKSTHVALVGDNLILIGSRNAILSALERTHGLGQVPQYSYHLWVLSQAPASALDRHEFGLFIEETGGVRIRSTISSRSPISLAGLVENARTLGFAASQTERTIEAAATLTADAFRARAGEWRRSLEGIATRPETPHKPKDTIRIYGLEQGVVEIPMNSTAPEQK